MVVSIEPAGEWADKHNFTIEWDGKVVALPVAFRVPGSAQYKLGAGPEVMKYLVIGDKKIPVTSRPDTEFRVGNEVASRWCQNRTTSRLQHG